MLFYRHKKPFPWSSCTPEITNTDIDKGPKFSEKDWYYLQAQTDTPGPHIMRIHLVRNSTSARFEKNPQKFT